MNEQFLSSSYVTYSQTLLSIRKSGEWGGWFSTWEEYALKRWGLSKARAKLVCDFAVFRAMCESEMFGTLPETPEQVKAILALPKKKWLETWEMVLPLCTNPVLQQNVESAMEHLGIYGRKSLPPSVRKAIRVRRAARTMAEMQDGEKLVEEIGGRALGKNWNKAVEVVIEADQARLNAPRETR